MLINDKRALAYTTRVGTISKIEGADNIELISVLGWKVIAKIGEFQEGDLCVYFEIDSKLPEKEWSEFMRAKHFKVKTMKLGKFGVISQGLALPISVFDVEIPNEENIDVTELLGVTYSVEEDNARKNNDPDAKYRSMAARRPNIFKKPWARWLMKREWGRKIMFFFFGKKKDKPLSFPTHFPFIHKTDEERCENMGWILTNKDPWVKTQKIDGTSSTYILERKGKNKWEYYVCSRNVRQMTPSQKNYHVDIEGNVYWMMDEKYHIKDFLQKYIIENDLSYACLQGETAGPNLQGNPHKYKEICFFGYNLIRSDVGRIDTLKAAKICNENGIPWVPIADEHYILPDTMEELKLDADGPCLVGEGPREGWVYRSLDGQQSFKNVSRKYLLKHGG
jgi:hypothetical protein